MLLIVVIVFTLYVGYSAFTDTVERKYHFPAPGWICMSACQALQGFHGTSQVSFIKEINFPVP
jgi:hypothetical protein